MVKIFQKNVSVAPKTNFGRTNFGCGMRACGRGAAMPKLLADTLRMLALLGCSPSCLRRRARPGTGVYALARARLRVGARGHARICTRSHTNAIFAKRGCSQKNGYALCEYEGRVQNQGRIMALKNGPCLDTVLARRCNKFPALVSLKGGCKSKRHGASAATMITYRGFPQQIVECEAHTADASSGPQILQKHKALQGHALKRACVAAASATSD